MQKILIAGTLTVAVGAGIYEGYQASQLKQQVQTLQQQQQPLHEQLHQIQQDRDEAITKLAAIQQEAAQLRLGMADLPKLRGEIGRLRESARELDHLKSSAASGSRLGTDPALESAFKTWAARATRLRQRLDQASDQHIPELQFLTEKNWFDAVKNTKQLDTDEDFRRAFSEVRNIAKNEFGNLLRNALRSYTEANGGQLPTDLSQLKPLFEMPVDDSVLQRYQLLQTGKLSDVPGGEFLVAETAPLLDEDHDARYKFSINGTSSHSGSPSEDIVKEAGMKFAEANNGLLPTDPAQLAPYLQQPVDPQKIQNVLSKIPPGVTTLQQLKATMR